MSSGLIAIIVILGIYLLTQSSNESYVGSFAWSNQPKPTCGYRNQGSCWVKSTTTCAASATDCNERSDVTCQTKEWQPTGKTRSWMDKSPANYGLKVEQECTYKH